MDKLISQLSIDSFLPPGAFVLKGGSRVTEFFDEWSDFEYSIWVESFPTNVERKMLYEKYGIRIVHFGEVDPARPQFGFADKLIFNDESIDLIWLDQQLLKNHISTFGMNSNNLWPEIVLLANLSRGQWLSLDKFCVSENEFFRLASLFIRQLALQKYMLPNLRDLLKLKARDSWPQLAAELYLVFQHEALTMCLQNKIFPIGEKWLLHEIAKLNPQRAEVWKQAFINPANMKIVELASHREAQ